MNRNKRRNGANTCEKSKRERPNEKVTITRNRGRPPKLKRCNNTKIQPERSCKRVTLPLGFFDQCVKSKTVRRNEKDCRIASQNACYLKEDLHALLPSASGESSPESEATNHEPVRYPNVTDYYVKLEAQQSPQPSCGNSIFKKVNSLFQETIIKRNESNINTDDEEDDSFKCKLKSFNRNLKEKLRGVTLSSRRNQCGEQIATLIAETNAILEGHEITPMKITDKKANKEMNPSDLMTSQLITRSNWLYQTPSGQNLRRPVHNSHQTANKLKPCIIQRSFNSKQIFEFDKTPTSLDFLNTSYNIITTPLCDVGKTNTFNFMGGGRNMVFSDNAVPFFEEPSQQLFVPNRPCKPKVFHENVGTSKCLFFQPEERLQNVFSFSEKPGRNGKENYRPRDLSNRPLGTVSSQDDGFVVNDNFLFPAISSVRGPRSLPFYQRKVFDT